MASYIYYVFVLKNLFQNLFGTHYPTEIINLIVLTLYKPIQIVAGVYHTILLYDTLYVWGGNDYGQLGLGDKIDRYYPQKLPLCGIKSVSCGLNHTIALTEDDTLYVWGANNDGQLGLGDFLNRNSPQKLILPEIRIRSIVCGGYHTIVLTLCGKIYVWGSNDYGQLGLGDNVTRNTPRELLLDHVESISCGGNHTIALTRQDEIYVWGCNHLGQLGLGDTANRYLPQKLSPQKGWIKELREQSEDSLSNIKSVSCGENYTIVLTSEGFLYSWGYNGNGQLGLVDTEMQNIPHKINLSDIKSINCGRDHNVAITISNKVYVWGENTYGQLGLGDNEDRASPQELLLNNIDMIVCGKYHTIAISNTGDIHVWGYNWYGQLGLGDDRNRNLPIRKNI